MHHFSVSEILLVGVVVVVFFLTFRAFEIIETTGGKQKQSENVEIFDGCPCRVEDGWLVYILILLRFVSK